MTAHVEADHYISGMNRTTRSLAESVHRAFVREGCSSYVKTIYIGYDIEGVMVAALYGHADHMELALALPEDHPGDLLVDATHLTWRTLPVAAIVRSTADLPEVQSLIGDACSRVRLNRHDVQRDNDFFLRSRRDRRRP